MIIQKKENAVSVDCTVNNNGHQRKCHSFANEVLPFDDPCCECTHGTAFNGTACIDESRCPCQENGIVRLPGEKWAADDDQCKIKSKHVKARLIPLKKQALRR